MLRIASLHIYPVKACAGVDLEVMNLDDRGPTGDRRYMIVDPEGRFVTQRESPMMALIQPSLLPTGLRMQAPGRAPLTVQPGEDRRPVRVWASELEAIDAGDPAAQWLSSILDRPVRLVSMAPEVRRAIDPPHEEGPTSVAFADGFPLLVTHTSSLRELNERLERPVTMGRFRANIVVDGGVPWEEDQWSGLRIGATEIRLPKPCERCKVITVDPETGQTSKEPLRTLATYRCVTGAGVIFGQNGIHAGPATIAVGDRVELLV
tara:strand:- start:165 stop:953 length:789 start_codon:yes stop_codon:yes gene_type:complete